MAVPVMVVIGFTIRAEVLPVVILVASIKGTRGTVEEVMLVDLR